MRMQGVHIRMLSHDAAVATILLLFAAAIRPISAHNGHHINKEVPGMDAAATSHMLRVVADSNAVGDTDAVDQDWNSPFKMLWGGATWPKEGYEHRPPLALVTGSPSTVQQLLPCVGMFVFAVLTAWCCYHFSRIDAKRYLELASDPTEQPLSCSEGSSSFGTWTHLHALTCAVFWRHLQRRAIFIHFLRIGIPVVLLVFMNGLRDLIASNLKLAEGKFLTASQTSAVSSGLLEFALTVAIVYVSLISMMFFVWHLNAELDSGLRHLLHVSGVSRSMYMLATVGVDGFCFILLEVLFMLAVAGIWLHVRMVLWTDPSLLVVAIIGVIISTLTTGYLLHLLPLSTRLTGMLAQIIMVLCTLQAPFAPLQNVVPIAGEQSWTSIAIPIIPAYRSLFELASACMRGRCLTVDDVVSSLKEGEFVGPHTMIGGTAKVVELSPPGALSTFMIFNACQLLFGWALVIILEMRHRPALNTASARPSNESVSDEVALEVTRLSHHYGWLGGMTPSDKGHILNGVSFSVNRGTVLGLLGPNGAGKTTCIRCITGEETPVEGTTSIVACAPSKTAQIGLCPQETVVNGSLTVIQNLTFFAYIRGWSAKDITSTVEHFLMASCLTEKCDCLPDTLSGGMKRRLAVACSLIGMPAVTVLDEPTTGLDPLCRRGIWKTINEIKMGGSCCLLTTHMLEEAEALCSRLVVLKKGYVAASGSVQQLKEEWGTGYMLSIESRPGQQDVAQKFLARQINNEDLEPMKNTSTGQMTFRLRIGEEALGHLIIAIAREKASSGIRHWGISQASLEDTYLKIVEHEVTAEADMRA